MRFIYIAIGFIIGISVFRNSAPMELPQRATVWGMLIVTAIVLYIAGKRDKASAVATAVATAVASAEIQFEAQLESRAAALAQNAVNVYMNGEQVSVTPPTMNRMDSIVAGINSDNTKMIDAAFDDSLNDPLSPDYDPLAMDRLDR